MAWLSRLKPFSAARKGAKILRQQRAAEAGSLVEQSGAHRQYSNHLSWPLVSGLLLASSVLCQGAQLEGSQEVAEVEEPPQKKDGWQLLDPTTRRRTFYKYERRIRDFSQPDKVFHYFASRTLPDGTRVMSSDDLIRAIVAVFPPERSESPRSGSLAGEPSRVPTKKRRRLSSKSDGETEFLSAFDAGNDGISYSEYLLLLTFLKIPAQDVKVVFSMFDLNDDGSINLREFEEITAALQARLKRVSGTQRTGAKLSQEDSSQGLKQKFFGPGGEDSMNLQSFSKFIEGMHEELLRLEFEHYDLDGDDTITGLDFARSILSAVDLNTIDTYLDRAAQLPEHLATTKVSYEQFRHFASLYQHVHTLAVALDFFHNIQGQLEKSDFKRATKIVTGTEASSELVDIVYQLFDLNGDGNLSSDELIAVLRKREGKGLDKQSDSSARQGLFSCLYSCAFNRSVFGK